VAEKNVSFAILELQERITIWKRLHVDNKVIALTTL